MPKPEYMNLFSHTAPIIVALSGGAASLCLLGTLHAQGYALIAAHFDHQLRTDSADDAEFAAQVAAHYQLPFVLGRADVKAYAKARKQSIEEAARNTRYQFLFAQARKYQAQAVAVGHTADDQAETILMHFLRGAGLDGLKGMPESTILPGFDAQIPLVRPILQLWRADTEAWCLAHNLEFRRDPTNADEKYLRNRLRHHLIPELENYNPRFREVLVRSGHALQGDYDLLQQVLEAHRKDTLISTSALHTSFSLSALAQRTPALIRNLIRNEMEKLLPDRCDLSFSTLEKAAAFILNPVSPQRIDLASGFFLLKEGDALHLTADEQNLPLDHFPQLAGTDFVAVNLPEGEEGFAAELGAGWRLTVLLAECGQTAHSSDPFQVMLNADSLVGNLFLRRRCPGDRFCPLGMGDQSVKLKEFLINEKLPRRARNAYPLLCDQQGIIWLPGYRPAQRVRLTDETKGAVRFILKRW